MKAKTWYRCKCPCRELYTIAEANIQYQSALEQWNYHEPQDMFWGGKRNHSFWEGGFKEYLHNEYTKTTRKFSKKYLDMMRPVGL